MTFYRPGRMEMGCVRPGLWRVEGYTVERIARNHWCIFRYNDEGVLTVIGYESTLTEACELIYEIST